MRNRIVRGMMGEMIRIVKRGLEGESRLTEDAIRLVGAMLCPNSRLGTVTDFLSKLHVNSLHNGSDMREVSKHNGFVFTVSKNSEVRKNNHLR